MLSSSEPEWSRRSVVGRGAPHRGRHPAARAPAHHHHARTVRFRRALAETLNAELEASTVVFGQLPIFPRAILGVRSVQPPPLHVTDEAIRDLEVVLIQRPTEPVVLEARRVVVAAAAPGEAPRSPGGEVVRSPAQNPPIPP